jgi:hypothetical protein
MTRQDFAIVAGYVGAITLLYLLLYLSAHG